MTPATIPLRRRLLAGGIGAALVAVGVFLVLRPLSAVVALLVLTAVALVVWAVSLIGRSRERPGPRIAAIALAAAGILLLLFLADVARLLPELLSIVLAANAVRLLVRIIWPAEGRERVGDRIGSALRALASGGAAVLAWLWPDLSIVAIGGAFGAALVLAGIVVLWRAIRPRSGRRDSRTSHSHHRGRRALRVVASTLAVALIAGGIGVSSLLRSTVSPVSDFYAWSGEVPATPGKLLRVQPYRGEVPADATAFRILYATTYSDGTPALASAVVAIPTAAPDGDRTVLAWQHGTTGVAQACAPSVGPQALTEYAIPGISRAIDRGWAVVATDYPGQGTSGRYPYLIGQGEGRATLDAVRALEQMDDAHASHRVMIWGHSQGGHATLWAGQIAADYAPELEVVGVAALSAAADPLYLAQRVTAGGSNPLGDLITAFVLVPYADEYRDINLSTAVHPAGEAVVDAFASRCVTDPTTIVSVLAGQALKLDSPLYRIDVTAGAVRDRLTQNIADGIVPAPLFLGQGADDEVIPTKVQTSLSHRLCAADRTVETHLYPGRTHMGVIAEGSPLIDDLYVWADAVAGGAQPTNCGD